MDGIGLFRSSSRFKRREEAAVMSGIDELLLLLYSASMQKPKDNLFFSKCLGKKGSPFSCVIYPYRETKK